MRSSNRFARYGLSCQFHNAEATKLGIGLIVQAVRDKTTHNLNDQCPHEYAQQPLGKVAMARGIAAVRQIRQFLGQLEAINETANGLNAALAVKPLLKRRGLVVFLTETGQPETAPQLIQAGQLLSAKHQVLVATLDDPSLMDILKQPVRQWQDPYRHFAVLEHQHGRELTRQQLQRHGVAITSAPAALLDRQVLAYYQNQRGKISGA
jgi:uncharacterized protein (DUF58 family)